MDLNISFFMVMIVFFGVLALLGWRASMLLKDENYWVRLLGTIFSVLMPLPVFLIVLVYAYSKRWQLPRSEAQR